MRKLHLLPLALLAVALGLVACGGGESDEDKIIDVIETSITSTDPADCEALATQAFLEQTEFSQGEEAVESCEENAKDDGPEDADSVEVTNVKVDGAAATADVTFVGGNFDDQALSVGLVEEDGDWKLDEVAKFAKLDQEKLASSFEKALKSEDGVEPQVVTCFGDVIRELSRPRLEKVAIGGSPEPIVEIIEGCSQE